MQNKKYSKIEKEVFIDKKYLIFLTFPLKYASSKKILSIGKRYPEFNIAVVFSKDATDNSFYHCFFGAEDFIFNKIGEIMYYKKERLYDLFNEMEELKIQFDKKNKSIK